MAANREELLRRLRATFLAELADQLEQLNQQVLELERSATPAAVWPKIFRVLHTLKGAAGAVKIERVERYCHRLEDIISQFRDGQRTFHLGWIDWLFAAIDALEQARRQLHDDPQSQAEALTGPLERFEEDLKQASANAPPTPTAPTEAAKTPLDKPTDRPASDLKVAVEKLDELFSQANELLVVRQRFDYHSQTLTSLREFLGRWKGEWQSLQRPLQRLMDRWPATDALGQLARQTRAGVHAVAANIRKLERDFDALTALVRRDHFTLEQIALSLQESVQDMRMVPFAQASVGLERVVRDLAKTLEKQAEFHLVGADVEMDRSIVEGIKGPLLHCLRNALDHGLEPPAERQALGKNPVGRITLRADLVGDAVLITLEDNGRGVNLAALRESLIVRGQSIPDDPKELLRLLFTSGLSTAKQVSDISGRGVGLDVVKDVIDRLRGQVDIESAPGKYTRFLFRLPLTLSTLRATLVNVAGQTIAIPSQDIRRVVSIAMDELRLEDGVLQASLEGTRAKIVWLGHLLELTTEGPERAARRPLSVLLHTPEPTLLLVDSVEAEQEIVVKPLSPRLGVHPLLLGGTILADGRLALVLNVAGVPASARPHAPPTPTVKPVRHLLVVDDSITTRTLVSTILQAEGFKVVTADDGADAWTLLQSVPFDLVVTDLEMPNMTGLDLTRQIRSSSRHRYLPVVMLTGRDEPEFVAEANAVGVTVMLAKGEFEQPLLLQTIEQLLATDTRWTK